MSGIIPEIEAAAAEMAEWRHDIHAHPEMAFEEVRTSEKVAGLLREFDIEVHRGLATTGVVGVLSNGDGPAIGLRADMDALPIEELTNLPYRSTHAGKMHACGHDGHTTMLLGAARHLSENKNFKGTVYFIFQPAEENEGGARVMVEEGLFDQFPMESVYGMHNWPGMPVGTFAIKPGPMMAAFDTFEAVVEGRGAHGAMPHLSRDPVVAAVGVVNGWQSIISRNLDPQDAAVISVTQLDAGDAWNVIPDRVRLRGTIRTFEEEVRDTVWTRMQELGTSISEGYGTTISLERHYRYPAVINAAAETEHAIEAASLVVGANNVDLMPTPSMAAEDFAYMMNASQGCYIWIGNGPGEGGCLLHNAHYDFNDEALSIGASYWVRLVESRLAP
jgi:amidohydrolase